MKRFRLAVYRFAYGAVSRLSNLTGGAALFVRWKVALAAVIISFSASSLTGCGPWTTCYEPAEEPTCYDPAPTCYIMPEEPHPDEGEGGGTASEALFEESAPTEAGDKTPDAAE